MKKRKKKKRKKRERGREREREREIRKDARSAEKSIEIPPLARNVSLRAQIFENIGTPEVWNAIVYLFDTRGKIKLVISTENYSMFSTGFEQSRLIGNEKKKRKNFAKGNFEREKTPLLLECSGSDRKCWHSWSSSGLFSSVSIARIYV